MPDDVDEIVASNSSTPTKTKTKSQLLDDFLLETSDHYGRPLEVSIVNLLPKLVKLIPQNGFMGEEPRNTVMLLGEIDGEVAEEFILEVWTWHFASPITEVLKIVMSCTGGDVTASGAIASILREVRRDGRVVHIHVAGHAQSSAMDILQCADHRSAEPEALFMTHPEQFNTDGNALAHKREGEASIAATRKVFEHYAARTGRTVDYYMAKVNGGEWYFGTDEALAEGLLDEVAIEKPLPMTLAQGANEQPKAKPPRKPRAPKPVPEVTE